MKNLCKDLEHYFRPESWGEKSPNSYNRELSRLSSRESDNDDDLFVEFACLNPMENGRQHHKSRRWWMVGGSLRAASLEEDAFVELECMAPSLDQLGPELGGEALCNGNKKAQVKAFPCHFEYSGHCELKNHTLQLNDSLVSVEGDADEEGWREYRALDSNSQRGHSESGNSADCSSDSLECDSNSDDDDGSVASRIFGQSSKCNATLAIVSRDRSNEIFYQKSLKIRGVRLQSCTEGLGSESSDVHDESTPRENLFVRGLKSNSAELGRLGKTGVEYETNLSDDLPEPVSPISRSPNGPYTAVELPRKIRTSKHTRKFPPPLSSISSTGKAYGVSLRPYRKDGRFVLQQIGVPCRNFLRASRKNGRLRLELVRPTDEHDYSCESPEVREEFYGELEATCSQEKAGLKEMESEKRFGELKAGINSKFGDGRDSSSSTGMPIDSEFTKVEGEHELGMETGQRMTMKDCALHEEKSCLTMGRASSSGTTDLDAVGDAYRENDDDLQQKLSDNIISSRNWVGLASKPWRKCLRAGSGGGATDSFGLESGDGGRSTLPEMREEEGDKVGKKFEGARSLPATSTATSSVCHDLQAAASIARMRAAMSNFEPSLQNLSCRKGLDIAQRKIICPYWEELCCVATSS